MPGPQIHGVQLFIHVNSVKKITDVEIALQGCGWPREAGLALEAVA